MAASSPKPSVNNILQFMKLIGQLKRVPRTGWVYNNVKKPESVSDHMYRMSMMAFTIEDRKINKDRCIKIALVHDLAECIVGDIAPADNISKEEKHRREEEAMKHLTGLLPEDVKKEIFDLWEEYEYQTSLEARLVKDLDLFEMILQAYEYEVQEKSPRRLQEFFDSTKGKFNHPEVLQLVKSLNEERNCQAAASSSDGPNPKESQSDTTAPHQTPETTS
ncbi:5'-deoxynucleotidase HDDC2 [Amia ocellicauda]|uniref:5'-deoxynucleotidase HDDC2 n=1 Tax=Amia ocellicauda TaxID=2972642 RepID=UPI003464B45C